MGKKKKTFWMEIKSKKLFCHLRCRNSLDRFSNMDLGKKPISVISYGNDIATKKTKFKKKSFVINLFKFPGNVLVKITSNLAGNYKHFHELKVFEKDQTIIHNLSDSFILNKKKIKLN